jgi:hypothetical protein
MMKESKNDRGKTENASYGKNGDGQNQRETDEESRIRRSFEATA